jgi:pre-mRNA-splicing factor SYF2
VAYERQKEAALGLAPGTLVPVGATSASLATSSRSRGLTAAEDLYRGADTLAYGDSKPSEEAIDRVIGKINKECVEGFASPGVQDWAGGFELTRRSMDKGKRKKKQEDDGEVNYINDRNKVFNKKVSGEG